MFLMMKKPLLLGLIVLMFLLGACQAAPETGPASANDGPCATKNLGETAKPLDTLLRAFDDAVQVATNVAIDDIQYQIAILQDYRRQVADLEVPACVANLKQAEITYMNSFINVFLAFMEGAPGEVINAELANAQILRETYNDELTVLLGATPTPQPTIIPWTPETIDLPTETPAETDGSVTPIASITPTPFAIQARVINPDGANVRLEPNLSSSYPIVISAGENVLVVARSIDSEWLLILHAEMPDGYGWVFASLVELQISMDEIPVADYVALTPTP